MTVDINSLTYDELYKAYELYCIKSKADFINQYLLEEYNYQVPKSQLSNVKEIAYEMHDDYIENEYLNSEIGQWEKDWIDSSIKKGSIKDLINDRIAIKFWENSKIYTIFKNNIGILPHEVDELIDGNTNKQDLIEFKFRTDTADQNVLVSLSDIDGIDSFIDKLKIYANEYDINEEIEVYLPYRGERGVPEDFHTLIKDMTEVKDTLTKLANDLDSWRKFSSEYKDIKSTQSKFQNKQKSPIDRAKSITQPKSTKSININKDER